MRELSLNVLDVAENSVKAGAALITITQEEDTAAHTLRIAILDDGCGMDEETVKRVINPFYTTRTTRKVGLGVPFFKMEAENTGGTFTIRSAPLKGTEVTAFFHTDHIDCLPVGDMPSTVTALVQCNPGIDFLYTLTVDGRGFTMDTREFRETLEGVPLNNPEVVQFIREYLEENTAETYGGV